MAERRGKPAPAPRERASEVEVRAVERTDAHEPLSESPRADDAVYLISPDDASAAEAEAAALLGLPPRGAALLAAPDSPSDRTEAMDSPPDLFAAIPDPEDEPEPVSIILGPTELLGHPEAQARFQQAETAWRNPALIVSAGAAPSASAADPSSPRKHRGKSGRKGRGQPPASAQPASAQAASSPSASSPRASSQAAKPQRAERRRNEHARRTLPPPLPPEANAPIAAPPLAQPVGPAAPRRAHVVKSLAPTQDRRPLTEPPFPSEPSVILDLSGPEDLSGAFTNVFDVQAEGQRLPRGRLVVLGGENDGKTWYLNRPRTALGRATDNDIVLLDISVSRHHLRLDRHGDGFRLIDEGSGNGTYLNGKRVTREELYDGDRIEVGALVLVFSTVGAPRERPAAPPTGTTDPSIAMPMSPVPRPVPAMWLALWAAVTFVAVVAGVWVTRRVLRDRTTPPAISAPPTPLQPQAEEAGTWLQRAEAEADRRAWALALHTLEVATRLSPSDLPQAGPLRARIQQEQIHEAALTRARALVEEQQYDEAATALATIAPTSVYATDAAQLATEASAAATEMHLRRARTALDRGQNELARLEVERVLKKHAAHPEARAILAAIHSAATREGPGEPGGSDTGGAPTPASGAVAAAPGPPEGEAADGTPDESSEESRARRAMAEGARHYRLGRYNDAIVALERAANAQVSAGIRDQARQRARWVRQFVQALRLAEQEADRGQTRMAHIRIEEAQNLDRRLGGGRSEEIRRRQAKIYYREAELAMRRASYVVAANKNRRALSHDRGLSAAKKLAVDLERTADRMLAEARGMRHDPARARQKADIVFRMSEPDTAHHRDAKALLDSLR